MGGASRGPGVTTTYPCSRCSGSGRLAQFGNVLGGVRFKCKGEGTQATKPAEPTTKWSVFGHDRNTGESRRLYNVSARTEAGAIERARDIMAGASAAFKDTNTLAQARAIRWQDMAGPTAATWAEATRGGVA